MIIRRAISSAQAMQVLDLLLTCYVNESVDELTNMTVYEEAKLYTYVSTKLNETNAEELNLHTDVLDYIPYFCDYQNSPQGQEPNSKNDLSAEYILTVTGYVALIVGAVVLAIVSWGTCTMLSIALICFAVMMLFMLDAYLPGIADILNTLQAFIVNLGMSVLTWLGPLGWTILRAALLALIYIFYAILYCTITTMFLGLIGLLLLMNTLTEFDAIIELDSIKIQKDDYALTIGYYTNDIYIESFELLVPTIVFYIKKNPTFEIPFNFFTYEMELMSENFLIALFNNTGEGHGNTLDLTQFFAGLGFFTAFIGSGMGLFGTVSNSFSFKNPKDISVFLASLVAYIGSTSIFLGSIYQNEPSSDLQAGLFWGAIISFIIIAIFMKKSYSLSPKKSVIATVIGLFIAYLSLYLAIREIDKPEEAFFIECIQFGLGFITLILGNIAVRNIKEKGIRNLVSAFFLGISAFIFIYCGVLLFKGSN